MCAQLQRATSGFVRGMEQAWGVTFPEGRNEDLTFMAHCWEDLRVLPKPLALHLASELGGAAGHCVLLALGFQQEQCQVRIFLFRPPLCVHACWTAKLCTCMFGAQPISKALTCLERDVALLLSKPAVVRVSRRALQGGQGRGQSCSASHRHGLNLPSVLVAHQGFQYWIRQPGAVVARPAARSDDQESPPESPTAWQGRTHSVSPPESPVASARPSAEFERASAPAAWQHVRGLLPSPLPFRGDRALALCSRSTQTARVRCASQPGLLLLDPDGMV